MLRLIAFGGVTLTRDDHPVASAATGRRRLAVLAVLAAAGRHGMSRDALAALLWPDSPQDQARHSLEQTLYATRRALQCDELFLGPATLRLNAEQITADVWEFEAAIDTRQLERAVSLYRGPFADGLAGDGAGGGEVERRLDTVRAQYARQYVATLETLAREAAARGDLAVSVRWRRRLADAEPLSARAARELIEALVAAGESAEALRFATVHEALIRQELDAPASPEITRWIHRLRGAAVQEGASGYADAGRTGPPRAAPGAEPVVHAARDHEERRLAQLARVLGRRYQLGEPIARGGVSVRYAATLVDGPPQAVEVHVLRPSVTAAARPEHFREVLTRVARLADPCVLPTFDFGAAEDVYYYVTARQPAATLRDRLRRERELPVPEAVRIARDVAHALAHAHINAVWHGDLRPKHVALAPTGVLVGSFGVVDAIAGEADPGGRTTVVTLGSPAYLSPEQLLSNVLGDERTDVYALGCMLYEMLAGDPPFGGAARLTGAGRKLSQDPQPLRAVRPRVPTALEALVDRCLARVPADRFPSGVEAARALAKIDAPDGT
jgi:DNA-binding SARP family transcriptional activator